MMLRKQGATPGATLFPTPGATPRQPPANGGATHTPIPPSVAPALGGAVHALEKGVLHSPSTPERGNQMTTKTKPDDENSISQIGDAVERELTRLVIMDGHDADLVLGQALARIFAIVTTRHGGDIAAEVARSAAQKCQGLPAYADVPLASMQPVGRA